MFPKAFHSRFLSQNMIYGIDTEERCPLEELRTWQGLLPGKELFAQDPEHLISSQAE